MNGPKVAEKDEYVLPPQDRGDTPEIRPSKIENRNVEDIYDEDHYTLARNSGFDKDFSSKAEKGNVEGVDKDGHYSQGRKTSYKERNNGFRQVLLFKVSFFAFIYKHTTSLNNLVQPQDV